jgi:hypothetical protein
MQRYDMKNISLSADESLIKRARRVANARGTTLNAAFREWLERYAAEAADSSGDALMRRLRHVRSSGPYTRDQMNER